MLQTFRERSGETGNHTRLLRQDGIGLHTRIPTGQGHDTDATRVSNALLVQIDLTRQGEFEHDVLFLREFAEFFQQETFQDIFAGFLIGTFDIDLS